MLFFYHRVHQKTHWKNTPFARTFSGLVVFILGITGCIYTFEKELKYWIYANKLFVEASSPAKHQVPLSTSLEAAKQALKPGYEVQRMKLYTNSEKSQMLSRYIKYTTTSNIWSWSEVAYSQEIYVNPYTAAVIAQEDPTFEFFRVVLRLH